MYNSQYYTCEQIDQRLLQGYLDDYNTQTGQSLTKAQFLIKLRNAIDNFVNEGEVKGLIESYISHGNIYCGLATPSGTPQLPNNNKAPLFFIAINPGTYTNYGNLTIRSTGLHFILWDTNTWSFDTVFSIDGEPTPGSDNLVKSGGVAQQIYNLKSAGYVFSGIAVPSVNPGVPTANCFYIVRGAGTYTYFKNADDNPIVIENDAIYVFTYDSIENNYWEYNSIVGIDNVPTAGSNNLVKSGGLYNKFNTIEEELDSIEFFTGEKVSEVGIDGEPTPGSDNLVKSGGVAQQVGQLKEIIGVATEKEVTETLSVNFLGTGAIYAVDYEGHLGEFHASSNSQYSDYIDISNHSVLSLNYLRMTSNVQQANILNGICFYDANKVAILGIPNLGDQSSSRSTIDFTVDDIPANAAYIRFTVYNDFVADFYASVKYIDTVIVSGLVKQVDDLEDDVDALEETTHTTQESVTLIDERVKVLEVAIDGGTAERHFNIPLSVNFVSNGGIYAVDESVSRHPMGSINTGTTNVKYTDYVDIRSYSTKNSILSYLRMASATAQAVVFVGICFYDSDYNAILGIPFKGDSSQQDVEISTISIPSDAAYIRFSCRNAYLSEFSATVEYDETVHTDGLEQRVEALENVIDGEIRIIENIYINYTNGNIETSSEYNSTDYIKIRSFEKFSIPSFTVTAPAIIGLAFYNRNKQYISGIHYPYKNTGYSFIRYIAPAEACFVRFTVLPNTTPYINIESQAPIAPYFNIYLAFNTPQAKGSFKIFMNFNNGVMLGSCGNDKVSLNDDVLIYRSTDWGITWTYLGNATQETSLELKEGTYYGDHDGSGNAIIGSGDLGEHYLLKISNYGASFPSDYRIVANATSISNIVGVTTNGVENVIYCGNNTYRAFCNSMAGFTGHNAVIESNDAGETWHAAASAQPLLASLRTVYKDSKGILWGAGMRNPANQGVWKSADNGLNWSRKSNFLAFQRIIEYNEYLFCGAMNADSTEGYVYRSADNGETWDKVLTVTKFTPIYHRTFIPYKNVLIAVFGQGEGSTSNEVSWQVSLNNGNTWSEINRTGVYEGGFVELFCIIGDTYYLNTHAGLQKM